MKAMGKSKVGRNKRIQVFSSNRKIIFSSKTYKISVNIHIKELWGFCNPFFPETVIAGGPYKTVEHPA